MLRVSRANSMASDRRSARCPNPARKVERPLPYGKQGAFNQKEVYDKDQ